VVIGLELGADLHMAQLMPCHFLSLASLKSRLVIPFWYRLTLAVPEKGPLNGCVCAKIPSHEGAGFGDTQGRYTQHYLQGALQGDATT